jgi:PAS domain S-box-containing protein
LNEFYYVSYQTAMWLSLLVLIFLLYIVWHRRKYPGARAMIALVAGTLVWTFGFLFESNSTTLARQMVFNNIGYLGAMAAPAAWFVFALRFSTNGRLPAKRQVVPICIVPAVLVLLVWTNEWHHLMWANESLSTSGLFIITVKTYEPFFWVAIGWDYILVISGAIILIRRLFVGERLFRSQAFALIIAVCLPLLWNIIYVFKLVPEPRKDLTPVMFSISGVALVLGLLRFRLLEARPFAYRYLMQQMNDGVFVFDIHDRLLEANPSALKITGINNSIIGKKNEQLSALSPVLARLTPVEVHGVELSLTIDGEDRFYELETILMHDNQKRYLGWMSILHDNTPSRQTRKNLQDMYEKEQALRRELEAEIKRRSDFARILVHELKTPLTAIIASSDLLEDELERGQLTQVTENIKNSAFTLNKRIGELLDITHGETGMLSLNLEDVSPLPLFREVIGSITPVVSSHNQTLILELPDTMIPVRVDKERIQQVMFNLIDNAMKYNSEGGKITLRAEQEKDFLLVSVQDTGYGISPKDQLLIFNPYTRLEGAGKRATGMGLGLAICKILVELHGGSIWVESEENKGSTFSFRIPLAKTRPLA